MRVVPYNLYLLRKAPSLLWRNGTASRIPGVSQVRVAVVAQRRPIHFCGTDLHEPDEFVILSGRVVAASPEMAGHTGDVAVREREFLGFTVLLFVPAINSRGMCGFVRLGNGAAGIGVTDHAG